MLKKDLGNSMESVLSASGDEGERLSAVESVKLLEHVVKAAPQFDWCYDYSIQTPESEFYWTGGPGKPYKFGLRTPAAAAAENHGAAAIVSPTRKAAILTGLSACETDISKGTKMFFQDYKDHFVAWTTFRKMWERAGCDTSHLDRTRVSSAHPSSYSWSGPIFRLSDDRNKVALCTDVYEVMSE